MNPHTGRDFVQFGKTESVLNKGAEEIAPLFSPPPVLSLEIMRNEPIEMDRKATDISGNLDADKIRQICSDHGITYTVDSACRGGVALEDVKNKRNQLAHGTTSFAECGRYYAIDDLEKIKNETVIFLNGILQGMKKYYDEKTYLKVVNN